MATYTPENPWNPLLQTIPKKYQAQIRNNRTFQDYFYRLMELAINMFEWEGLPDTVDERFLELTLCEYGFAVYFNEPDIGDLALTCAIYGPLDVYRIPIKRRAYAVNGFQRELTSADSVLVFNNYLHMPSVESILLYATRLTEIERTIEVNVHAQKTPVTILCDEAQRLTMEQVYKKYSGNEPVIIGTKAFDLNSVTVLKTDAPYVADKLSILKRQIWNEALTLFGISNSNTEKKERLVTDEITSNLGAVEAQRFVMLNARRQAAKQINRMFGTNISVNFREETPELEQLTQMPEDEGGEETNG